MSVFSRVFGTFGIGDLQTAIEELYPFPQTCAEFVELDMVSTFSKILTDTCERVHGLNEEQQSALSDSCLGSEASKGLITLLAEAMTNRKEIAIVYKEKVIRIATPEELKQIQADYKTQASSKVGILVSFEHYTRSEMLEVFSGMEYAALASLHKTMNLAKATQVKVSGLRKSVGQSEAASAIDQGKAIARALKAGKDVMIDADDVIENAAPDVTPTKEAISFIDAKRGYVLGFPAAYVTGVLSGGIGSTGEADAREVERGLKQYFTSIIRPVCSVLFAVKVTWKTQDFRELAAGVEVAKGMELVSDDLVSLDDKKEIVERALGITHEKKK